MANTITHLDSTVAVCPKCGSALAKVPYYRARRIDASTTERVLDKGGEVVRFVTACYDNVFPAEGRLCLACGDRKERPARLAGLFLLILGGGTMIAAFTGISRAPTGSFANGPGAPLTIIGGLIVGVIGLAFFVSRRHFKTAMAVSPADRLGRDYRSTLFVEHAEKEHPEPGISYLSTGLGSMLRRVRRLPSAGNADSAFLDAEGNPIPLKEIPS